MKTLGTTVIFVGTLVGLAFIFLYAIVYCVGGSLMELWQNIRRGPPQPP